MGIVDEEALTHVVISSIEMNNDMSIANVYLSIGGNAVQRRRIFVWLCKHLGQIRHALHQRMRNFKRVPLVNLNLVDTVSEEYLDSVLDEIATSNARSADANAGSMFKDVDFEEVFDENVENDDDLEDLNIDESMDYDEQDDYS
jgi:ribosome-binding factor A